MGRYVPLREAECRRKNRRMVGGHLLLRLHSLFQRILSARKKTLPNNESIVSYLRIFHLLLLLLF